MTERIDGVYCAPVASNTRRKISLRSANKILLLLLFISGIYYITTVNDLVVKGFVSQELKVREKTLKEDIQTLNVRSLSLKSCDNVSARISKLNMVAADKIDYIKVGKGVLAAK